MDPKIILINMLIEEITAGLIIPGYAEDRMKQLKEALEYLTSIQIHRTLEE